MLKILKLLRLLAPALLCAPAAALALNVEAPCSGRRTGATVLGLRSCSDVLHNSQTGTLVLLRKKVEDYHLSLYESMKEPLDSVTGEQLHFGPPFCNVVGSEFTLNKQPEITKNRSSKLEFQSCGTPLKLKVKITGIPLNPKARVTFDNSGNRESLEAGYIRGTFGAALACFHSGISNMIKDDEKIPISSECESLGRDIESLGKQTVTVTSALRSQLSQQLNIEDIDNWFKTGREPRAVGEAKDPGPLRQSAQQLAAARTALEAAFTSLAACEVFARAGKAYMNVTYNPQNSSMKHSRDMTNWAVSQCDHCGNNKLASSTNPDGDAADCVNSCYQGKLAMWIQNRFGGSGGYWPNNARDISQCKVTP